MKRLWVVLLALGLAVQTGQAGTLNLQVGASNQDADQLFSSPYTMYLTGATNYHGGSYHSGHLFTGVSGLSGASITVATLTFRAVVSGSEPFVGDWYAHDLASPGVFTTSASNISSRTRTTATCEGDGTDFGNWTSGLDYTFTGDGVNTIANIIQELANSHVPTAIALLFIYASGTGTRRSSTWDNNQALAAKLDITYSAAASGPSNITSVAGTGTITGWCGTSWSNLTKWCRP